MTLKEKLAGWRNLIGITPIFALFLAALIGLPVAMVFTVREQMKAESLENARAVSELMLQFRRYYNLNIVGRLQQGEHPPVVTEQYKDIKGAIPIPATMSIEVADLLTQKISNSPFDFGFVSDHPFKGRNRPALDTFQLEALQAFRKQPELKEYWRQDRTDSGSTHIRLAIPVKMQKACVECHNIHPDSSFRAWRIGDVRGVQDVTVRHSVSEGRMGNFVFLGGYMVVFAVLLFLALHEYRRSNLRLSLLNREQTLNRAELEDQSQVLLAQMEDLVTKTTVLDKAPFGIVIADPDQQDWPIVYINQSFSRITGYAPSEVLGRNCRFLQGPDTSRLAIEAIRKSLSERKTLDIELLNYRRDGSTFMNRLQLFPCVTPEGRLISYVGCVYDVTELKTMQIERENIAAELQESRKLESLGLAIAGIAHDLNTPIGVALTATTHLNKTAQQLKEIGNSSEQQVAAQKLERAVDLITNNLKKASDMVRSFKQTTVDASRIEWRKVLLRSFLESLMLSVSPIMKRARCRVTLECPDGLNIYTEPGSLNQVITNLLVNASIHAFEGVDNRQVRVTVSSQSWGVRIEVADNGKGMTHEAVSKAFSPFFTTNRGSGGSGLGLFSSRRIIENVLGGQITFETNSGRGSTFFIDLPVGAMGPSQSVSKDIAQ